LTAHDSWIARLTEAAATATPDECVEWDGTRLPSGYGKWERKVDGKRRTEYAHRWALLLTVGPPPDDEHKNALHSCHNPPCVNPYHLRWGTTQENIDDRQQHGAWHEAMAARQRFIEFDDLYVWLLRGPISSTNIAEMRGTSATTVRNHREVLAARG
jgi:hypothetical protein